ncbi:MAG: NAD-dependent epimerase/dehydratase family protein [Patescibacteria group bacterium]
MNTYVVTGGAGFIGSHLTDRLLEDGHRVIVIDDFSLGKKENLSAHENLIVLEKSVTDDLRLLIPKDTAAIYHEAALPRVQFSIAQPWESHVANADGTLNMLLIARDLGIKRFVFASSSSVYGDQQIPLTESQVPKPISPYALQKLIGEHYCRLFAELYGLETVSLRYFNVFGPRQNPDGAYAGQIPKFFVKLLRGETPQINGDGEQTRDNTYVDDVVEANILAATRVIGWGDFFNIGGGHNHSVNETTKHILEITKSDIIPSHGPAVVEPKNTLADISKAKSVLGWEPKTDFETGLKKTYEYFATE